MLLSFGGSVHAMIIAIKNNKKLLKHRNPFKKWKRAIEGSSTKAILPDKEATPEHLKQIRERYVKHHKRNRRLAALALLATGLIIYFIFGVVAPTIMKSYYSNHGGW